VSSYDLNTGLIRLVCLFRLSVPRELVSKESTAGDAETVPLGKKDLLFLGTRSV